MFKKPSNASLFIAVLAAGFCQLEAQTPEIVPLTQPQLWAAGGVSRG